MFWSLFLNVSFPQIFNVIRLTQESNGIDTSHAECWWGVFWRCHFFWHLKARRKSQKGRKTIIIAFLAYRETCVTRRYISQSTIIFHHTGVIHRMKRNSVFCHCCENAWRKQRTKMRSPACLLRKLFEVINDTSKVVTFDNTAPRVFYVLNTEQPRHRDYEKWNTVIIMWC